MMFCLSFCYFGLGCSFPMFFRVSEHSNWTVRQALSDSLAACMVVTILLDLARLALEHATSLPWLLK
jgi:hypothetical protein